MNEGPDNVNRPRLLSKEQREARNDLRDTDAELSQIADRLGVSREALLLPAVELRFASPRFYGVKRRQFEEEYEKMDEASEKPVPIAPDKTMINRYGRTFARIVLNSYHDRRITVNDAAAFLNVQAKHIDYIARQAMSGA